MHVTDASTPSPSPADPVDLIDLVVVGAGIAGLAAALTAAQAGGRVVVLDAHPAGGRARTTEVDGVLHNTGPHALYRSGEFARLLARHGVTVSGGSPPQVPAHLVRDGVAQQLSLSPLAMLRTGLLRPAERVRLLALFARVQAARPERLVGRSVASWLGDTPTRVRQFVEMLIRVSGYTDAPDLLDAGAALAQLKMAIGDGVQYVDGGWGSMVDAMVATLERHGGQVRAGSEVVSVRTAGTGADGTRVEVVTSHATLTARSAVIATGGPDVASRLTGTTVSGADRITAAVTASVLDLVLAVGRPVLGFGLDSPLYLSAHAPAARLTDDGRGLVSVMRYHRPGVRPDTPERTRHELEEFAERAGIARAEVTHERFLHRLVVSHGAPTAAGGGLAGRPTVDALGIPGVFVAGDWVGAEGQLADAAAASGAAAAHAATGALVPVTSARGRASIVA